MAATKRVSLLIANYNGAQYLDRALQSALRQSFPSDEYEIIVADDGSTDHSVDLVHKYNDRVTLLKLAHAGLPATCNEGIAVSGGDYLIRLDSDDAMEPQTLTRMVSELDSNPSVAFVTADRWDIEQSTGQRREVKVNPNNMYEWIAPGIMFRTAALREVGSYSPLYWEEYDLFIRLLKRFKSMHLQTPLYHYYRHAQSMTAHTDSRLAGWRALIQKWGMTELRKYGQCQELEDTYASSRVLAKTPRLLVAAQDAGGCNSLLPVLKVLRNHPIEITAIASGPAQSIFERHGFVSQSIRPDEQDEALTRIMDRVKPDMVFVGNSYGPSLEDGVVRQAQRRHIPNAGLLDSWLLYDQKFTDGSNRWAYLPDRLIVMDDFAKKEMMDLGAPADRLFPMGQPQFDHIFERSSFPAPQKEAVREKLGLGKDEVLVLFLSQDMQLFYGGAEAARQKLGYTEYDVLNLLQDRLKTIASERQRAVRLAVKLHPREEKDKYQARDVLIVHDADLYDVLLSADLVVGMDTILLIEAGLLRCATLSLQPHRRGVDTLITNRMALGQYCYDPEALHDKLDQLLFDPEFRENAIRQLRQFPVRPGAAQRIASSILSAIPVAAA